MDTDYIVIGLTGPFGSGCTYIAKEFIEKRGYQYSSLSDILRKEFRESNNNGDENIRNNLQEFGNKTRENKGKEYLAKEATKLMKKTRSKKWIIDSIRNTHEVEYLKKQFSQFYLISVWADKNTRWDRVSEKYDNNINEFNKDDERDSNEKFETGQQVSLCYQMADIVILNTSEVHSGNAKYIELKDTISNYIDLIEHNKSFTPSEDETLMAMAYANSFRSSCLQRKVGALIKDDVGSVFSSGFNDVPSSESSCQSMYGQCYRKNLREKFYKSIDEKIKGNDDKEIIKNLFAKQFKNLDYCRSLHAEENAIVNLVRLGISFPMEKATLYTTTYPCNLCANKIAQVGIKTVVYFEPYPMKEAKKILEKHKIIQKPFEGITYNGYFRFVEVMR